MELYKKHLQVPCSKHQVQFMHVAMNSACPWEQSRAGGAPGTRSYLASMLQVSVPVLTSSYGQTYIHCSYLHISTQLTCQWGGL